MCSVEVSHGVFPHKTRWKFPIRISNPHGCRLFPNGNVGPFISKWKCWAIYFQIEMLGHLFSMDNLFQVPGLQKGRRWRNTHTRFHWSFHETDRAARPENSTTLQVNVVSRGRDGSIGSFLFSQPSFVRQAKFHGRGVVLGRFMMEIQEMPMRIIVRKI